MASLPSRVQVTTVQSSGGVNLPPNLSVPDIRRVSAVTSWSPSFRLESVSPTLLSVGGVTVRWFFESGAVQCRLWKVTR